MTTSFVFFAEQLHAWLSCLSENRDWFQDVKTAWYDYLIKFRKTKFRSVHNK